MKVFLSMQLCSVLSELVLTFLLSHLLHKISLQLLCKTSHGLVQHDHLYLRTLSLKQFIYCSLACRKISFYYLQKLFSRQSPPSHFTWIQQLLPGLRSETQLQVGERYLTCVQNTKSVLYLAEGISKKNDLIASSTSSQTIGINVERYFFCT